MRRRNWVWVLIVSLVSLVMMPFSIPVAQGQQKTIRFKFATMHPEQDTYSKTMRYFKDIIEEKTNGRIRFTMFYGDSLIPATQFFEGVSQGIVDITSGPTMFIEGRMPEVSILGVFGAIPYDLRANVEKVIRPTLIKLCEQKNVRYLYTDDIRQAYFGNNKKLLKTPADWTGLMMRAGGRWQSMIFREWGAKPAVVNPGDMYIALQRGTIDGFFLPLSMLYSLKLHELCPYLIQTELSPGVSFTSMNLKKWHDLSPEDKKIFEDASDAAAEWSRENTVKEDEAIIVQVRKEGATVYKVNDQERAEYLKACYAIWPKIRETSGPLGNQIIDILEKYRRK